MKPQNRNRSPIKLSCVLSSLLLSVTLNCFAEQDQDGDGLSDEFELAHGLDPNSFDSNADGLSDYSQFKHLLFNDGLMLNSVSAQVPDANDSDGDGLNNFLETYGFYIVDGVPVSVPRQIPSSAWAAIKGSDFVIQGVRVFDVALSRLELDGRARLDEDNPDTYLVNLEGAKRSIIDAFLSQGIGSTNIAIEGSTRDPGSAANIIKTLLEFPRTNPTDARGKPLPVFYTHPNMVSSDRDPFTDYDEALGNFPAGRPLAPADHPLFAAAPDIRVNLESFEVVFIEQNRTTLGEGNTELKGRTTRESRSHSHGFSLALKSEWEGSFTGATFKKSVEFRQSNSISFGSATTLEQRNSHSTYIQNSTNTQSDCFAKLDLTMQIENAGYATASNISLAFNVYLGNTKTPWETLVVNSSNFGNLLLAPGQSQDYAVPRIDQTCLTVDETNYLAQGGTITIETIVADATVDFFDEGSKTVVSGGSWQTYNNLIQQDLAKLNLDVNASNGKQINHSIYYYSSAGDNPNLQLSVEQALATAFERRDCDASLNSNTRCFVTEDGDELVLGPNTYLDLVFFDAQGVSIGNAEMQQKYNQLLPLDNSDPFTKILPTRSALSIVNNDYEVPQFTHIELINLLRNEPGSQGDLEVRTTVSDFFGVAEVYFCFEEGNCQEMQHAFGETEVAPHSGLYRITLPEYHFTGNEFVKAVNNIGNESPNQTPEALFMSMHASLAEVVEGYIEHAEILQTRVNALSTLQFSDPVRYEAFVGSGFVSETGTAQYYLYEVENSLAETRAACSVSVGESVDSVIANFQAKRDACLQNLGMLTALLEGKELKIFDINKLPGNYIHERDIGRTKAGRDRGLSAFSANNASTCRLEDNQYVVGISMGKINDKSTPVHIQLYYVEYDPVTRNLSGISRKDCGGDHLERETILDVDIDAQEAELILDVGARLDDNIKPINGKSARWIGNLCVSYRKFSFATGAWIDDLKFKCNNEEQNQFVSVESQTGLDLKDNDSLVLKGLTAYHNETKTSSYFKEIFGEHAEMRAQPFDLPFETLSEFGQYHIVNEATGEFLTVTSASAGSASLGMDTLRFDDSQIWKVERLNDREMRLIPQSFTEGAFVKNPTLSPSVAKLGSDATAQVGFNQRLIISKQNASANSPYLIRSVVDRSYLSLTDNQLAWQDVQSASSMFDSTQKWVFVPVTNTPEAASKQTETIMVANSRISEFLFDACQVFDLGADYYIEEITVNTAQSRTNKSNRLVFLSDTEQFSVTLYPPNSQVSFTRRLGALTSRTNQVEICNGFAITPPGVTNWTVNDDLWLQENRVQSIEVKAVRAD